jgi:hypothetical protein
VLTRHDVRGPRSSIAVAWTHASAFIVSPVEPLTSVPSLIEVTSKMSFGVSISDIIGIANLARQTYANCVEACGRHATITAEVRTLRSVLWRVHNEAGTSTSLFDQTSTGVELMGIIADRTKVLNQTNRILHKHSILSTKRPNLWDGFGFGTKNFGELRRQISAQRKSIILLILSTTSSEVHMVDTELGTVVDEFQRIQRAIDSLTAAMRPEAGAVWTVYSDDDLDTWRQIRRDLIKEGIPSKTLHKYPREIKSRIRYWRLGSELDLCISIHRNTNASSMRRPSEHFSLGLTQF